MIITEKDTTGLVNSQEFTTRRLGIKASGWSHIASILRDQLYSDKILAPIREYSTNAMDAHVEKGIKNRPIVVKLPNSLSPTFCVRDFGFGMSEDKVWDIFANYGESTKRNTNEQVGMLGIGSKSAFAYGDSFLVISFQGGFKTTYALHVAGSKEGDIVKMGVGHTTEEDGIEVQIPVRKDDIKEFLTRAEKFFKHWDVMPIFEGGTIDMTPVEKVCQGEGWFVPTKGGSSVVIMGNIAYVLDRYSIKFSQNGVNNDEEYNLVRLFNTGASFVVPIGSVDVAASRETLQYTDKTIKAIIEASRNTLKEITDMVLERFNKCKTMFEKKCLIAQYNDYDSPMYHLNYILSTGQFKNFTSSFNTDQSETKHGFKVRSFAKSRRGNRKVRGSTHNEYQISCRSNFQYIQLDSADLRPLNRISVLMERDNNTFGKKFSSVYTIEVTNKSLFNKWVTANQFDIPLIQFASLPIVKTNELYPSTARAKTSYVGNVKNGKKILTVDFTVGTNLNRYALDSDCFKIEPLVYPTDGGVKIPYIVIDRYRVSTGTGSGSTSGHSFVSECNLMMKMLNFTLPTVVAVRPSEVNKLDKKKFVPFSSFITDVILANPVMVQSVVNANVSVLANNYSIKVGDGHQIGRSLLDLMVKKINLISNKTNVAYLFLTNLKSMSKISNRSTNDDSCVSFIKNYTTLNITKMVDSVIGSLIVEGNKFVNTYPMITTMDEYRVVNRCNDPKIQNTLFEYVNFVDAHRKSDNV